MSVDKDSTAPKQNHPITVRLVRKAKTDRQTFDLIYDELSPKISQYIRRSVGNEADAADLVQEVFLRAYTRLEKFADKGTRLEDESSFPSYLYKIATNEIIKHWRHRGKVILEEIGALRHISNGNDPSKALLRKETKRILYSQINNLKTVYRKIIYLRYFGDMSLKEIAHVLEMRHQTVIEYHARATKELQKRLRKFYPDLYP